MYISKCYPKAPLLGLGFSLGANVLTRYLAEEGDESRLRSGCVLACVGTTNPQFCYVYSRSVYSQPWDLLANSEMCVSIRYRSGCLANKIYSMEGDWFHRMTYSRGMAGNLKVLLKRHQAAFAKKPESELYKAVEKAMDSPRLSLIQFDDIVTRLGGGPSPPFPFPSAQDYYRWSSSHKVLPGIRVPFLALNSADDPIVKDLPTNAGPDALGPWVAFCVTEGGGHLGWFERGPGLFSLRRWMSRPVIEWLRAVGEDVAVEVRGKAFREVNGFVMEKGGMTSGTR